jgi:hypothetical protein
MAGAVGLEPTWISRRLWRPLQSPLCETPVETITYLSLEFHDANLSFRYMTLLLTIWILCVQMVDPRQRAHTRFQHVDLAEAVCFVDHAILWLDGAGILTEARFVHHLACCWINGTPFSPVCFTARVNRLNEVAFASALGVDNETTRVVGVGKEPFKEVGIHVIILGGFGISETLCHRSSLIVIDKVVHDRLHGGLKLI